METARRQTLCAAVAGHVDGDHLEPFAHEPVQGLGVQKAFRGEAVHDDDRHPATADRDADSMTVRERERMTRQPWRGDSRTGTRRVTVARHAVDRTRGGCQHAGHVRRDRRSRGGSASMTRSNLPEPRRGPESRRHGSDGSRRRPTLTTPWRMPGAWSVEMQQIIWTGDVAESERWDFNDVPFQVDGVDVPVDPGTSLEILSAMHQEAACARRGHGRSISRLSTCQHRGVGSQPGRQHSTDGAADAAEKARSAGARSRARHPAAGLHRPRPASVTPSGPTTASTSPTANGCNRSSTRSSATSRSTSSSTMLPICSGRHGRRSRFSSLGCGRVACS